MDILDNYSLHIMLTMLIMATIANGIIFYKAKTLDNFILLSALFLYSFVLIMGLFFGPSATFDSQGQELTKTQGVLSFTQTITLELLAHVLLAL